MRADFHSSAVVYVLNNNFFFLGGGRESTRGRTLCSKLVGVRIGQMDSSFMR